MQLKKPSLRQALSTATCGLLALPHAGEASGLAEGEGWQADYSFLYYSEKNRVSVYEPLIKLRKDLGDDEFVNVQAIGDVLTGASPNGASATNVTQTYTTPSGGDSYSTDANEFPLKDFSDYRAALDVSWEKPLSRLVRRTLAAAVSGETDYTSLGLSVAYDFDNQNRQTTINTGIAVNADIVHPQGQTAEGLSSQSDQVFSIFRDDDDDDDGEDDDGESFFKGGTDLLLGVTHILSKRSLMQLNYTAGYTQGYLTDPYKLLSVVDDQGRTIDYRYEKRPDSRLRQAVYTKWAYHLPRDVVHVSYRYFFDDWGVRSHTVDMTYYFAIGDEIHLVPHLRYYQQQAADFYHHSLRSTDPLPDYASADMRLGSFTGTTIGLKYQQQLSTRGKFSVRLERMVQEGDSHPDDAVGLQQQQDLFPTLEATIFQITYSIDF